MRLYWRLTTTSNLMAVNRTDDLIVQFYIWCIVISTEMSLKVHSVLNRCVNFSIDISTSQFSTKNSQSPNRKSRTKKTVFFLLRIWWPNASHFVTIDECWNPESNNKNTLTLTKHAHFSERVFFLFIRIALYVIRLESRQIGIAQSCRHWDFCRFFCFFFFFQWINELHNKRNIIKLARKRFK